MIVFCQRISCMLLFFTHCILWKCLYQVRTIAVFPVFRLLTDFVCLLIYEFCLSFWKIARCSVILLLPLFINQIVSMNQNRYLHFNYYHFIETSAGPLLPQATNSSKPLLVLSSLRLPLHRNLCWSSSPSGYHFIETSAGPLLPQATTSSKPLLVLSFLRHR